MKSIVLLLIAATFVFNANAQQKGSFVDIRDGKTYKTVIIGNQEWMAENLAYKPSNGNYWAYEKNQSNVGIYGYLYDYNTALSACPSGWYVPSYNEWTILTNFLGDSSGIKLKAKSRWSNNGNGTDDFDFAALPGGFTYRDKFAGIGNAGLWWSSDEMNNKDAWRRYLQSGDTFFLRHNYNKSYGLSVRCVKD